VEFKLKGKKIIDETRVIIEEDNIVSSTTEGNQEIGNDKVVSNDMQLPIHETSHSLEDRFKELGSRDEKINYLVIPQEGFELPSKQEANTITSNLDSEISMKSKKTEALIEMKKEKELNFLDDLKIRMEKVNSIYAGYANQSDRASLKFQSSYKNQIFGSRQFTAKKKNEKSAENLGKAVLKRKLAVIKNLNPRDVILREHLSKYSVLTQEFKKSSVFQYSYLIFNLIRGIMISAILVFFLSIQDIRQFYLQQLIFS
jgi:hypothetical protein